jgi:hypothetical protein
MITLEELDGHKKGMSEVAAQCPPGQPIARCAELAGPSCSWTPRRPDVACSAKSTAMIPLAKT